MNDYFFNVLRFRMFKHTVITKSLKATYNLDIKG